MRIHEQAKYYKDLYQESLDGIYELRQYLNSSKSSIDANVNKNDILMRLQKLDNRLFDIELEV